MPRTSAARPRMDEVADSLSRHGIGAAGSVIEVAGGSPNAQRPNQPTQPGSPARGSSPMPGDVQPGMSARPNARIATASPTQPNTSRLFIVPRSLATHATTGPEGPQGGNASTRLRQARP